MKTLLRILLPSMLISGGPALAQQAETPQRTTEARIAIEAAGWQEVEPGLLLLRASTGGLAVTAFQIDQEKFAFGVAVQESPDGERVDALGPRGGALIAVNGGFFGEKSEGKGLYPVGLLRIDGKVRSPNWARSGGYILFGPDAIRIEPSSPEAPAKPGTILQSKPLMIEPGGKWAMNTNQALWRPRTLLCALEDGKVVLLVLSGSGMSLYEAGWLMRAPRDGGHFGCDAALALDGGGSTQLWVENRDDLAVEGETAVHNGLVVKRR